MVTTKRASVNARFTFTMMDRIRQVFIRSARKEVGRTLLPVKFTLIVNANGALAFDVGEHIQEVLQQADCKLSTCDNSSCINCMKLNKQVSEILI